MYVKYYCMLLCFMFKLSILLLSEHFSVMYVIVQSVAHHTCKCVEYVCCNCTYLCIYVYTYIHIFSCLLYDVCSICPPVMLSIESGSIVNTICKEIPNNCSLLWAGVPCVKVGPFQCSLCVHGNRTRSIRHFHCVKPASNIVPAMERQLQLP